MKGLGLLLLLAAATSASALTTTLRAKYWYYGDTPYPIIQSEGQLLLYTPALIDDEFVPEAYGLLMIQGAGPIDGLRATLSNMNAAVTMMQKSRAIPGVMSSPIGFASYPIYCQGGWVSSTNGPVASVGPVDASIHFRMGDDDAGNACVVLEVLGRDLAPLPAGNDPEMRGMPIIPFGQGGTPNAADFAAMLFPLPPEDETAPADAEDGTGE